MEDFGKRSGVSLPSGFSRPPSGGFSSNNEITKVLIHGPSDQVVRELFKAIRACLNKREVYLPAANGVAAKVRQRSPNKKARASRALLEQAR